MSSLPSARLTEHFYDVLSRLPVGCNCISLFQTASAVLLSCLFFFCESCVKLSYDLLTFICRSHLFCIFRIIPYGNIIAQIRAFCLFAVRMNFLFQLTFSVRQFVRKNEKAAERRTAHTAFRRYLILVCSANWKLSVSLFSFNCAINRKMIRQLNVIINVDIHAFTFR